MDRYNTWVESRKGMVRPEHRIICLHGDCSWEEKAMTEKAAIQRHEEHWKRQHNKSGEV